jgi:hypothetical protein
MREQRGYIFHRGKSWFVRRCDDVLQSDISIKRKLVCKKLPVPFGDQYRSKQSVQPFVEDILRLVNSGTLNPQSTMAIAEFVENICLSTPSDSYAPARSKVTAMYGKAICAKASVK